VGKAGVSHQPDAPDLPVPFTQSAPNLDIEFAQQAQAKLLVGNALRDAHHREHRQAMLGWDRSFLLLVAAT